MKYYYGQIRPTNYDALRQIYGHEPPWDMEHSPHVSLARMAIGGVVSKDLYLDYMMMTREKTLDALNDYRKSFALMKKLVNKKQEKPILLEHNCIKDGNHRWAMNFVMNRSQFTKD